MAHNIRPWLMGPFALRPCLGPVHCSIAATLTPSAAARASQVGQSCHHRLLATPKEHRALSQSPPHQHTTEHRHQLLRAAVAAVFILCCARTFVEPVLGLLLSGSVSNQSGFYINRLIVVVLTRWVVSGSNACTTFLKSLGGCGREGSTWCGSASLRSGRRPLRGCSYKPATPIVCQRLIQVDTLRRSTG